PLPPDRERGKLVPSAWGRPSPGGREGVGEGMGVRGQKKTPPRQTGAALEGPSSYSSLTTRSARPPSPSTTERLAFSDTFSRTSSSRRRISVGLVSKIRAVLACERIAAVSSRRVTSEASAAFFASVTLLI